jgi:hypothetical protein
MYEWADMDEMERGLLNFGTKVDVVISMLMGNKITEEDAWKEIKEQYKSLKKIHKQKKDS